MGASDSRSCCSPLVDAFVFQPPPNSEDRKSYIRTLARVSRNTRVASTRTDDGVEVGLVIVAPRFVKSRQVVVFSYGNRGDLGKALPYLTSLCRGLGVAVVGYDYPGYGLSGGRAGEDECTKALGAVVSHLVDVFQVMRDDIILFGHSLGTAVVVNFVVASKWRTPVMLVAPCKSVPRVVCDTRTCDQLLGPKFNSASQMFGVQGPVRIFHGEKDTIIPITHGKELYESLADKSLAPVWLSQADHFNILGEILLRDIREVLLLAAKLRSTQLV